MLKKEKEQTIIKQEIIARGGKANYFDVNGRNVGEGNGDLNH